MPTISILGLSAQTKVHVTEPPELATASLAMMVLLANVLCVQTTAMIVEHAGLRSIWLLKLDAHTQSLGMP
jgi:hypothetical protein